MTSTTKPAPTNQNTNPIANMINGIEHAASNAVASLEDRIRQAMSGDLTLVDVRLDGKIAVSGGKFWLVFGEEVDPPPGVPLKPLELTQRIELDPLVAAHFIGGGVGGAIAKLLGR